MSEAASPAKTRYKTRNWAQYNGALKARGSLTVYLDRDMQWLATPSGKRGRQQLFSDASIQFCLVQHDHQDQQKGCTWRAS